MNVPHKTKCFCLHSVSGGAIHFLRLETSFGDCVDTPNFHQMSSNVELLFNFLKDPWTLSLNFSAYVGKMACLIRMDPIPHFAIQRQWLLR